MDTLPARPIAAVVALEDATGAKSRMSSVPAPVRERLARCMAMDTLSALGRRRGRGPRGQRPARPAARCSAGRLPGSGDRRTGAEAGAGHGGGLNRALAHGDALLRAEGVEVVLASVGDLPALRAASVGRGDRRLARSTRGLPRRPRGPGHHDADRPGRAAESLVRKGDVVGRTIGSAVRHRRRRIPLALGELLRCPPGRRHAGGSPVRDLIGMGPATASLLDPATRRPGLPSVEVLDRDADESPCSRRWPGIVRPGIRRRPGTPGAGSPSACRRVAGALRCWA